MKLWTKTGFGCLAAALMIALAPVSASANDYWQCVPVARILSGIQLFGDAYTWWRQAPGKYDTGHTPQVGSVLVFKPNGKMRKGHVAVVSSVITERIIQVTHANWSEIEGHRGQIEDNVTVEVWYDPAHDVGTTTYPVYGFIYQNEAAVHQAGAVDGVQLAADLVNSLPAAASRMVNQTNDAMAALIQSATGSDR